MKLRIALSAILLTLCISLRGQNSAIEQAFVNAPMEVFPLLEPYDRLDMLDYRHAGMQNGVTNSFGGTSAVTALDEGSITLTLSNASRAQLVLLPERNDTVYMLIRTVDTPAPDSEILFYDAAWKPLAYDRYIALPAFDDWVTDAAHMPDVQAVMPFMLVSYSYDSPTATLTLTNNVEAFLPADVYAMVSPWVRPQMRYTWQGGKFKSAR